MAKVLQLLRNTPLYEDYLSAHAALTNTSFLNARKDGELVVARYKKPSGSTFVVKQLLGVVYIPTTNNPQGDKTISFFDLPSEISVMTGSGGAKALNTIGLNENSPITVSSANSILLVAAYLASIEGNLKYQPKLEAGTGIKIEDSTDNKQKISVLLNNNLLEIVTELPTSGNKDKIYLKVDSNSQTLNIYSEYVWVNNAWEKLGDFEASIDLDGYIKGSINNDDTTKTTLSTLALVLSDDNTHIPSSKLTRHALTIIDTELGNKVTSTDITNAFKTTGKLLNTINNTQDKGITPYGVLQGFVTLNSNLPNLISSDGDITGVAHSSLAQTSTGGSFKKIKLSISDNAIWDCGTYTTS